MADNAQRFPSWVVPVVSAVVVGVPVAIIFATAFKNASVTTTQRTLIVSGSVIAVALLYLLVRVFLYTQALDRRETLLGYRVDEAIGELKKGSVRNVALRVATITELIDTLSKEIPGRTPEERLRQVGLRVGETWSSQFQEIRLGEKSASSFNGQLELWTQYDATAGWGRFEFHLNAEGHGSVTLLNGFLTSTLHPGRLEHFIAGYLESTLGSIYGTPMRVYLDRPDTQRVGRVEFMVEDGAPSGHNGSLRGGDAAKSEGENLIGLEPS